MTKVLIPPTQNVVGICKQLTIIILYEVSSRLVILLKFSHASLQVFEMCVGRTTLCFKLIKFTSCSARLRMSGAEPPLSLHLVIS
jgi:hypothetical protein